MLTIFRPFRVGDFIEAAGSGGMVEELRIFSTVLHSAAGTGASYTRPGYLPRPAFVILPPAQARADTLA